MKTVRALALPALFLSVVAAVLPSACSSGRAQESPSADVSEAQRKPTATSLETQSKTGSQLWEETCGRCHNFRSPSSYSAKEWDVTMRHMRLRAYLTAEQEKAIGEFLKSGSGGEPRSASPKTTRVAPNPTAVPTPKPME